MKTYSTAVRPPIDLLMSVLLSFMRHQQRLRGDLEWTFNPRQKTLMSWISRRFARLELVRTISRATLNRWLAGAESQRFINREKKNFDPLTGKIINRASKYTFARRGMVWIKNYAYAVGDPLGRLDVSDSRRKLLKDSDSSNRRGTVAVDKSPTATAKGNEKTAELRRRSSSTIAGELRRPSKALSRGRTGKPRRGSLGAKRPARRTQRRATRRSARRRARRRS